MRAKPVSIILLCRNRWALTRRCLRALRRFTDPRLYELQVFDNASTDSTRAGLRRLGRGWPELRVTRNPRNLSFSAAVNRGMRRSGGRLILWLNNDTVPSAGWLEGLVAAADSDPAVAAAGPMTDQMAPPDQKTGLRPRRSESGTEDTTLLGGFCFLVKRSAVERVGLLDERFAWGWEDVDYCLRLRQAGWRLVLARGVFLRHVGNATISRMPAAQRRRSDLANRELIRRKWTKAGPWGDDVSELIRLSPAAWHPPPLAASVIVAFRGGAARARACLDSVRRGAAGLAHEVLAVDMGQDPGTSAALHRLAGRRPGLTVLGPWGPSSPAQALNRAAGMARGDYLAFFDDAVRAEGGWLRSFIAAASERTEESVVVPEDPACRDVLLLRRRSFERAGGFDERLAGPLCADDLCLRLVHAGHAFIEAGGARVRRAARDLGPEPSRDRQRLAEKWLDGAWAGAGFQERFWRGVVPPARLKPLVSVVVVCRGPWERSERCLDALRRNAGPTPYEVLAVGACPGADEGLEAAASAWPQLRVVGVRDPHPHPRALNEALRSARGDYFAVLADDTAPAPGWLEGLVAAARSDPATGVVTPGRRPSDACLLIPRAVFLAVGEFDDRYRRGQWAEDYRLRAKQRGFHLLKAASARVSRAPRPSSDDERNALAEDRRLTFDKWAGHAFLPLAPRR